MDALKRIEELMKQRGWSLYRLSKESGVSQSTLSSLYKKNYQPTLQTLESICKGFGISMSQFFAEGEEPFVLSAEQRELVKRWDSLSPELKAGIWAMMEKL